MRPLLVSAADGPGRHGDAQGVGRLLAQLLDGGDVAGQRVDPAAQGGRPSSVSENIRLAARMRGCPMRR